MARDSARYQPAQSYFYEADFTHLVEMTHKLEQDSKGITPLKDEASELIKSFEITKHQEFDLKCDCMKPYHFMIVLCSKNDSDAMCIHAIEPLLLNGRLVSVEQGPQQVNNFDDLQFPCSNCTTPHLYKFIIQRTPQREVIQKSVEQESLGKP